MTEPSRATLSLFLRSLSGGGAERVFMILARELARRGHDVEIVVARPGGTLWGQVPEGVRLEVLGSHRQVPLLRRMSSYLRARRPRALLATPFRTNLTAVWAARLARSGVRVIVREANNPIFKLREVKSLAHLLKKRTLAILARPTYLRTDGIVAVSHGVADAMSSRLGLPRDRIRVIHNPVDVDDVQQLAAAATSEVAIEGGGPLVVAAGRLAPQKDHETLLRAFEEVARRAPSARLLILGEGPQRRRLESRARNAGLEDRVLLPGFVQNPYALMARASTFVLSSAWEGFPNVLLEALALGRPIVATDCPSGPREILAGGKWGQLVPVADPQAMAAAILASFDREPESTALVARARAFAVARIVDEYLEVLLGEPARGAARGAGGGGGAGRSRGRAVTTAATSSRRGVGA